MSVRRVVVIEPDPAGRRVVERLLAMDGIAADAFATVAEAERLFEADAAELVLVDELAGTGAALDEVRHVRALYPSIPVVVTGTILSPRVLRELLRLDVAEALTKPFTPDELRESIARVRARSSPVYDEALEHAASMKASRRALVAGRPGNAELALARAQRVTPLDAEAMALRALAAELVGRDRDADRAYRAALALRDGEELGPPDPHEGLARLALYGSARPVGALLQGPVDAPIHVVGDVRAWLAARAEQPDERCVVLLCVGVDEPGEGVRLYLRESSTGDGFAVAACTPRATGLARALAALGPRPLLAGVGTSPEEVVRLTRQRDDERREADVR